RDAAFELVAPHLQRFDHGEVNDDQHDECRDAAIDPAVARRAGQPPVAQRVHGAALVRRSRPATASPALLAESIDAAMPVAAMRSRTRSSWSPERALNDPSSWPVRYDSPASSTPSPAAFADASASSR